MKMSSEKIDKMGLVPYFAYGSNMNPQRMRERGVTFYSRQHLVLHGYELVFNKIVKTADEGAANIVPNQSSLVEGTLYLITWQGIFNLDRYEQYPNEYDRVIFNLSELIGLDKEVYTYIAHPHKTREGLKPKRSYLEHLLEAKDILSENYYKKLKKVETLD